MKSILYPLIFFALGLIADKIHMSEADHLYKDKRYSQAAVLYDQECEKWVSGACTTLSFMYDKALGIPKKDHEEACHQH